MARVTVARGKMAITPAYRPRIVVPISWSGDDVDASFYPPNLFLFAVPPYRKPPPSLWVALSSINRLAVTIAQGPQLEGFSCGQWQQ